MGNLPEALNFNSYFSNSTDAFVTTIYSLISVGGTLEWATIISTQGGINMGPRRWVFPQVFMKSSTNTLIISYKTKVAQN